MMIEVPQFIETWPTEESYTSFKYFEALLEISIIFQQLGIVDDDEWSDYFQLKNSFVCSP